MSKRPQLEDNAAKLRVLELELEVARLKAQTEPTGGEEASGGAGEAATVDAEETPPAPHPGVPAASSAVTTSTSAPTPTTTTTTTTSQEPLMRGRGRGARGARGRSFSLDFRGLQTIFVCEACDKIYCQTCNHYEQTGRYWARQ